MPDSALLTCETCGNHERIWLNRCKKCSDPSKNWYEARIAELEAANAKLTQQRVDIGIKYDLLNAEYKRLLGTEGE